MTGTAVRALIKLRDALKAGERGFVFDGKEGEIIHDALLELLDEYEDAGGSAPVYFCCSVCDEYAMDTWIRDKTDPSFKWCTDCLDEDEDTGPREPWEKE